MEPVQVRIDREAVGGRRDVDGARHTGAVAASDLDLIFIQIANIFPRVLVPRLGRSLGRAADADIIEAGPRVNAWPRFSNPSS
jgi:hypothetical protein